MRAFFASSSCIIMSALAVPGMSEEEQLDLALKRSAEEEERKKKFVHSTTSQDLADALAISKLTADAEQESRDAARAATAVLPAPPPTTPIAVPVASPIAAAPVLVIHPSAPFAVQMPDGSFGYYDATTSSTLTQWILASPMGGSWQIPSSTCEVRWGSAAAQFFGAAAPPGIVQVDQATGATASVMQRTDVNVGAPSATSVRSPPSDSLASRTAAARLERAAAREEEKKAEEKKSEEKKERKSLIGRMMKGLSEVKGEIMRDEWSETLMHELVEGVKGKDVRGDLRNLVDFEVSSRLRAPAPRPEAVLPPCKTKTSLSAS